MCLWASFLPPHWASAKAVWLLRVWCSRNVPDIDVTLPAKWFHIRASCVIQLGAGRYPALSEDTAALTVSPPVWNLLKCTPYASCLVHSCLSPTAPVTVMFLFFFWKSSQNDGDGLLILKLANRKINAPPWKKTGHRCTADSCRSCCRHWGKVPLTLTEVYLILHTKAWFGNGHSILHSISLWRNWFCWSRCFIVFHSQILNLQTTSPNTKSVCKCKWWTFMYMGAK